MQPTERLGVLFLLTFVLTAAVANSQTPISFGRHVAVPEPLPVGDGLYEVTLSVRAEGGAVVWERSYPRTRIRGGSIEARFAGPPAELDLSGAWLEVLVDGQAVGGSLEIKAPEDFYLQLAENRLEFRDKLDLLEYTWVDYDGINLNLGNIDGGVGIWAGDGVWSSMKLQVHRDGHVQLFGGTNATLEDDSGYLMLGLESQQNLVLDDNEIQARNNRAPATLFFQHQGGDIWFQDSPIHTSDRREKREVRDLTFGLEEILRLRPVSFEWKNRPGPRRPGLVAQEVQEVFAELVTEDDEGTLGLAYGSLVPILIRALQEQQEAIEQLQRDLTELRSQARP